VGGVANGIRQLKTRRGDRMAVFSLDDDVAKVEAVVFPEAFGRFGHLVVDDAMLLARGKYERDEETSRLVVAELTPLDLVQERTVREVVIHLNGGEMAKHQMRELADVMERHPGDRRVSFVLEISKGPTPVRVRTATARRIKPSEHFVRDVEAVCGAGCVTMRQ
jgi:DNA polymerase-3 subunit alpha